MMLTFPALPCLPRLVALAALCALGAAVAATDPPAKSAKAAKPAPAKTAKSAPAKPVDTGPAPASPEQIEAAERVYYGIYDCEFNQTVDIAKDPKHAAYVEVKHGKSAWMMKPVVSTTGAIRLEDVKGETLMVQIASKSMLLNVKTARRIVDDCISPKQRELIEAAKAAKTAEAAASAAAAAASAAASAAEAAAKAAEAASAAVEAASAAALK